MPLGMIDVFGQDPFTFTELTTAINKVPYKPERIARLGLFEEKGVATKQVMIEEKTGQLALVPVSPRGGVPESTGKDDRRMIPFVVPHLAKTATIQADEVIGVRAFGSQTEMQTIQGVVDDRLLTMRNNLEATLEYHRLGAIKGQILDANGLSVVLNLFTAFGVEQNTGNFDLGDEELDVNGECIETAESIEEALGSAKYDSLRAFCASDFHRALFNHPIVRETYKYQEGNVLRGDPRSGFTFGGITWEVYRGSVGGVKFVPDGTAYVFPEGVITSDGSLFITRFAPGDYQECVGQIGLPIYAKQAVDPKFQKFTEIEAQSNPLCLCRIPRAVVKLTKTSE